MHHICAHFFGILLVLQQSSSMDLVKPYEHLCYVRCSFCNIVLEIRIPCKRMLETVTVKCGQCSNLSYLSAMPPPVHETPNLDSSAPHQSSLCSDSKKLKKKKNKQLRCLSPNKHDSTSRDSSSSNAPFVVKPPERKHRPPSAYNRFMREEIQRIKAANPNIPHRDAFSAASKNWARCSIPSMPLFTTISDQSSNNVCTNE